MANYIDRDKLMENVTPWLDGSVLVISADSVYDAPAEKVVPINEVFRLIAGHSNYHGDDILSALTCVSEGKIVQPIKSLGDIAEVVKCKNCKYCKESDITNRIFCTYQDTEFETYSNDFCSHGERSVK